MTKKKTLGVGVIGCGNISAAYFRLAPLFRGIEMRACADLARTSDDREIVAPHLAGVEAAYPASFAPLICALNAEAITDSSAGCSLRHFSHAVTSSAETPGMRSHSFSAGILPETLEAKVVQDADHVGGDAAPPERPVGPPLLRPVQHPIGLRQAAPQQPHQQASRLGHRQRDQLRLVRRRLRRPRRSSAPGWPAGPVPPATR